MKHVLSSEQFTSTEILEIMSRAKEMEKVIEQGGSDQCQGKILATLFYEPSTRTRLSFETAMLRLGGNIISETDVNFSSAVKGEILADTIRIVANCADVIALRSRTAGDAEIAAQYSSVPVLNAGDGIGEHPTQSLLDFFTIQKHFNLDQKIKITFVGDLKYGRTVHSLSKMLRKFDNFEQTFIAPEILQIPDKYTENNDQKFSELTNEILKDSDVIYDTRIQKERFQNESDYESLKNTFVFDTEKVSKMSEKSILMHPLPRINEISQDVDNLSQAKYFEQARNGIPVRMALIASVLKK